MLYFFNNTCSKLWQAGNLKFQYEKKSGKHFVLIYIYFRFILFSHEGPNSVYILKLSS